MGLLLSFMKPPKHKRFSYQPRYYDEAKERHQKRMAKVEAEKMRETGEKVPYEPNIKGQFSKSMRQGYLEASRQKRKSNLMLFIILAGLIAAAYFLYFQDQF